LSRLMPRVLRVIAMGALLGAVLLVPAAPAKAQYGCPGFPPPPGKPAGGVCTYSDTQRMSGFQNYARSIGRTFYTDANKRIRLVDINSTSCGITWYHWVYIPGPGTWQWAYTTWTSGAGDGVSYTAREIRR
jgi:hypothetical protein